VDGGPRLTRGEAIAALGGALLLAAMFFDWFEVTASRGALEIGEAAGGPNAWEVFDFTDLVLMLAAALGLAQAVGRLTGGLPRLPLPVDVGVAVAGAAALVLVAVALADPPVEEGRFPGIATVDSSSEPGAWAGLAACALIVAGGLLAARERSRPGGQG
jgi:hypothetical protein